MDHGITGKPALVVGGSKGIGITDLNGYRESFELHTMSQIFLLNAVPPGMGRWVGPVLHTGSATAKEPAGNVHHAVATTSRPSTIGLLNTVSDEYARDGITHL